MSYLERIPLEPGKPDIRSGHITVNDVVGYLTSGMSVDDVLRDFPDLKREDMLAAMQHYAVNKAISANTRRTNLKASIGFAMFFALVIVVGAVFSPYEPHWLRLPAIYAGLVALTYASLKLMAWLSNGSLGKSGSR